MKKPSIQCPVPKMPKTMFAVHQMPPHNTFTVSLSPSSHVTRPKWQPKHCPPQNAWWWSGVGQVCPCLNASMKKGNLNVSKCALNKGGLRTHTPVSCLRIKNSILSCPVWELGDWVIMLGIQYNRAHVSTVHLSPPKRNQWEGPGRREREMEGTSVIYVAMYMFL